MALTVNNVYGIYGKRRHRGAELMVFGEPTRGLRLLGGATLLDTEQLNTADGLTDGNRAVGVPRLQANAGVEWDVPGVEGLTLTGRVVYTSSQYADLANQQELPAWTRYDIGARYLTEVAGTPITLRARIDNVTNKNYWASAGGYGDAGYLVLGGPRTFMLTASAEF
jgi:iron complex outermembrane receptor protein